MPSRSDPLAQPAPRKAIQALNRHPIAQILGCLPLLPTATNGEIQFDAADPLLLGDLREAADTTARMVHLGTGAIGQLMAQAAPELEDGTIGADAVEALGWLLAALGELGAQSAVLALRCAHAAGRIDRQP